MTFDEEVDEEIRLANDARHARENREGIAMLIIAAVLTTVIILVLR